MEVAPKKFLVSVNVVHSGSQICETISSNPSHMEKAAQDWTEDIFLRNTHLQ